MYCSLTPAFKVISGTFDFYFWLAQFVQEKGVIRTHFCMMLINANPHDLFNNGLPESV